MATKFSFGGKIISLPGVYSRITSGFKNPPNAVEYGNVIFIDNGSNAGYGGGAGINGTLESGKDAVYVLSDSREYQDYMKGGILWKLTEALFSPSGVGSRGVSKIIIAKAATTVPAEIGYTFTGGGTAGGVIAVQVRDEGIIGNGFETTALNLYKGYAGRMVAGSLDSTKFKIKFYRGNYKGLDSENGVPYDGISQDNSLPILLTESDEFDNVQEFIDWTLQSADFNKYFVLKTGTVTGTGVVDAADLAANAGNELAAGGTETYSTDDLDDVLDAIKDVAASFVFADSWGDDAMNADNGKILAWINNEAKFDMQMIVGGGRDNLKFDQASGSIPIAQYYNSDRVIVCHGGVKVKSNLVGIGFLIYDAFYKAALVVGKLANLPPQVPITFKRLNISGELHNLTEKEQIKALDAGVLHTILKGINFVVNQGINSLQNNKNLINDDGTTHSIQVRSIGNAINLNIIINADEQLLSQQNGVNRSTLSEKNVSDWTIGQLAALTANQTNDNLILGYRNVVTVNNQDAHFTTYEFLPNNEINKLFFTGNMKLSF